MRCAAAAALPGSTCAVDVRVDRYELSLPPKLTYGEIKGFTLYATRTILSGEGEELLELAESNLRDLEVE
jgi:pyruvate dehydrogenase (quinone)